MANIRPVEANIPTHKTPESAHNEGTKLSFFDPTAACKKTFEAKPQTADSLALKTMNVFKRSV